MKSIPNFLYSVDRICREDLSIKNLVSERDCVSRFCTLIRFPEGALGSQNQYIHSGTLQGSIEQKIGCDALIIFKIKDKYKICFFEAKYPRYKSVNSNITYKPWDDGRFNEQLKKQQDFIKQFPVIII